MRALNAVTLAGGGEAGCVAAAAATPAKLADEKGLEIGVTGVAIVGIIIGFPSSFP
jgi:hypothetical protein